MVVGRKVNFGVTLPLACYMTLGKFPNLANSEFPHLQNSDNKSPYLLWLLGNTSEIIYVMCWHIAQ